jgi:hypothetical protein
LHDPVHVGAEAQSELHRYTSSAKATSRSRPTSGIRQRERGRGGDGREHPVRRADRRGRRCGDRRDAGITAEEAEEGWGQEYDLREGEHKAPSGPKRQSTPDGPRHPTSVSEPHLRRHPAENGVPQPSLVKNA